jgi:hypothetical protein
LAEERRRNKDGQKEVYEPKRKLTLVVKLISFSMGPMMGAATCSHPATPARKRRTASGDYRPSLTLPMDESCLLFGHSNVPCVVCSMVAQLRFGLHTSRHHSRPKWSSVVGRR